VTELWASGLALIFDLDGVVIDSNPFHRLAWEQYNRRHGIETTEEMHRWMYGKRNDQIVRGFFGGHLSDQEVAAHGAAKERLYRELLDGQVREFLVPGVAGFLARHRDLPVGLGTNAEPPNVDFVLDGSGLRPYFRATVNGHEVAHPKPDPEIYLRVAERLGVAPRNCMVFEDSPSGIAAARAAGMALVGVRTTHRDLTNTDLAVDHFLSPELEPWLEGRKPVA
jgi:beta-phosphoglucomutase family hydrolase